MLSNKKLTSLKPFMFTAYYDWFIENEITPHLMVDANIPGVKVPAEYVKDGCIILSISPSAIADYQCLKSGISFKARFKGQTEDIYIPYIAMSQLVALESGAALPIGRALEQLELGDDEDLTPDEGLQSESSLFSLDDESEDEETESDLFDDSLFIEENADSSGEDAQSDEPHENKSAGQKDSKDSSKPGFEFVE